ncbi:LOW QUALITY PROTEIN: hypothetical protein HZS_5720 [Henneguya salminicola]|nr:LOW QUALITY PROTEIN: hypothetical protein HZS_5720 [Henneguya salminicola]
MNEYLKTPHHLKKIMILYNFGWELIKNRNHRNGRYLALVMIDRGKILFIGYFHLPYSLYVKSKTSNYNENIIELEFKNRKNSAVAVVSNCGTEHSLRLKYISELQKYFSIDTYGTCSTLIFLEKIGKKDLKITNFYYLLRIKYWDAIFKGAIPIVLGHDKNLTDLIPDSYINVFHFSHPKYLSQYMRDVSSNIDEFKKYYQWRKNYFVTDDRFSIDPCTTLRKISDLLATTIQEDDTIHKIFNLSICLEPETVSLQIIT